MSEFVSGNRLQLLDSGREYFPALLAALAQAECEIHLESYIFADDPVGRAVADALCRAARRGVRVNVIVDGFGARNFPADFRPQLTQAGVQTLIYRPELDPLRLRRHRLRRLHRKLVVIDARIAFVGGINIIDDHNAAPEMAPRYDYAVRIEGPVLAQICLAARRMWEILAWVSFKRRYRLHHPCPPDIHPKGEQSACFLIRDSIRHRNDIQNAYLEAIRQARDEILIANAYVLPGWRFGQALLAAAARGVRITILLQGKTDHPLLHYATRALYARALAAGIRIYEYEKSFMHAKVAVIDDHWATVGSSNIDPFSLLLAKEGNLVIQDKTFALTLKDSLQKAIRNGACEMHHGDHRTRPWYRRPLPWLAYWLVRALSDLAGYGQRHWHPEAQEPPENKTKP